MQSKILVEPVLVGRERELAQLENYLELALESKGSTVFVSGEAGAGKTRLITEFLSRARKHGVAILAGWCLSNAAVPYFPFFEAFNAYFSGEHEPKRIEPEELEITAWLMGPSQAEKVGKPQAISPQVWKDQTFVAVARTLASISANKPVILFVDDVQWADSASLSLIHYVARAMNSERVLVLAAFRSEQLAPDAEGRPHPLVETLRFMRREDLVKEIRISNLNQEDVSTMASNMLGGDLQAEFAEKLADESQGNPLFVVESLRMLHERNGLIQERDQWRLTSEELGIPAKIKDIILQRLGALSRNQREVLDAASVIGEKFDIEVLASVLGQDSLDTVKTLDTIAKNTSLVSCGEKFYRFDHASVRGVLYDEISDALKRGYHARVAEKLEAVGKGGKLLVSDLAYHFAQAGNEEKAVKYALAAGQDALARWSNTEAIKHFTYAVKAVGKEPERAEERLSATEGLGDAFYANGMYKESMKIYEELGDAAETDAVKLRALRKAMASAYQLGDPTHLMELVKKAEPYAAADPLETARALAFRGLAFTLQFNFLAAIKDIEAALQVFEEEYSLLDAAQTSRDLGFYRAAWAGKLKEGLAESLRSATIFEELGCFGDQMLSCWVAGLSFSMDLLLSEALEILEKAIEIDEKMKMGNYHQLVFANSILSRCLMITGDFEKALDFSLKALEFSRKTDSITAHGMVYSNLTLQYTRLGDLKHAEEYFEKLMKLPPEIFVYPLVMGNLTMAVFFAGRNQWKKSDQAFKEFFERFKRASTPYSMLRQKQEYAWSLERQGRFEEARVQLEEGRRIREEAEARFEHADLQAHLMVRKHVVVGEEFEMRLDLVNVGRRPGALIKIAGVLSPEFEVAGLPAFCSLHEGSIQMKEKGVGPFQVETIKLKLKATKEGSYDLNPEATYVDDLGKTRAFKTNPITITAQPPKPAYETLPGRIPTGSTELDRLLLGGIPEKYAVVLAAPSSDERALLIKRFLEAGAAAGEITFQITAEAANTKELAERYPSNFHLFVCNPQADTMVQNASNVFKLKGVENLTDIDIALTKAFRTLKSSATGPRRICIEIVSDVLLQHHAVTTRRWLSALLPTLKSKGFTVLAVVDPQMHPPEELQAILGVFDGEIRIIEKETPEGIRQTLRIRKLLNQKYLENEIVLAKEKMSG